MDKWRINGSSIRKGLVTLVILFILSATLWEVRFYKKAAEMKQYNEMLNTDNVKLYSINESTITQSAMTLLPIQSHGRLNCTDESCSNLLSTSDLKIFKQCAQHASKRGPIDPGKCKFMNGKDRQPIGLISFPGSGNTWVRGLLQQVTGFCTGSVYCDPDLRRHGFVGENIATGSVLVIKTHRSSFIASKSHSGKSKSNLQQVVFIIRNPYDSIISERNRKLSQHISNNMDYVSSHVQTVGAKYFGDNLEWIDYVTKKLKGWQKLIEVWLEWGQTHPLLVVQYEDLVNNTSREIDVMLRFIGIQISLEDIRQKLRVQFNSYHRKGHGNFTHYTTQQISQVNDCLRKTQEQLMRTGMDTKYNLYVDKYVRHYKT